MRIFLLCPARIATGGTELLHQFSRHLSDMGIENYMIYPDMDGINCPVPDTFLKYGVKYVRGYIDAPDSVLVLPETQVHFADACVRGAAVIWWLSVDNYLGAYKEEIKENGIDCCSLAGRKNVIHFVQSYYAKTFLKQQMGINADAYLKDYINDDIVNYAKHNFSAFKRQNICLYNPKKGFDVLKPIIEKCRTDIRWMPLQGLNPVEMATLMCISKVYVDFGNHPGKDRIPREAAICGCCIMTNRKGSARFSEDVNIPDSCKVDDTEDIDGTLQKIYDLVDNYDQRLSLFSEYRERIEGEKQEFMGEVIEAAAVIKDKLGVEEIRGSADENDIAAVDAILEAIDAAKELGEEARSCYMDGNLSEGMNRLLTIDYITQLIRETLYARIQS